MEKIKINNQIVCMRKYVKQAKVHTINKLVKQIKFLQNRKGSESQVQKAKRKAERFLEAVALLKKIKPDDVSKLALSKTKDWKQILTQKSSSLHDRCLAMLANYGAVQKEVEVFYDANKELVLRISDYIKQWEEKNKLSKDLPKTNEMSLEKKSSKNIQKRKLKDESLFSCKKNKLKAAWKANTESDIQKDDEVFQMSNQNEKNNLEGKESDNNQENFAIVQKSTNDKNLLRNIDETEDSESDDDSTEAKELDSSDEEIISDENGEKKEITINSLKNDKEEAKNSSDEESIVDKMDNSISKSDLQFKIDSHSKNKLKAITLLNLNELEGLDEIPVNSSFGNDECDEKESSKDEMNETLPNKSADPFFLSNTREDSVQNKCTDSFFLSHNKADSNGKQLDDSFKDSDVAISTEDSLNPRTQTFKNRFSHNQDRQFSPKKNFLQKTPYDRKKFSKSFNSKDNYEKSFKREKFAPKNYPNKFQEKYINRNRKDINLNNKPYPPRDSYERNQFNNASKSYGKKDDNISLKSKVTYKKGNLSEPLHPSWEARKKQKELLSTSFQGKRMVFKD